MEKNIEVERMQPEVGLNSYSNLFEVGNQNFGALVAELNDNVVTYYQALDRAFQEIDAAFARAPAQKEAAYRARLEREAQDKKKKNI